MFLGLSPDSKCTFHQGCGAHLSHTQDSCLCCDMCLFFFFLILSSPKCSEPLKY